MKKLSVLFLIAILGIVLWALPAGAEKIRLTDAELDGITGGAQISVPPLTSPLYQCCAQVLLVANGGLMPVNGNVSLAVTTMPLKSIESDVRLSGAASVPGNLTIFPGFVLGPKGLAVPLPGFIIPIP